MIEFLEQYLTTETTPEGRMNRLREALQLVCLKTMQDAGAFSRVAFVGGTALRILYDMRRFSEDLDFSVTDPEGYDFAALAAAVERGLALSGLEVEMRTKDARTVQSSLVKFPGLLKRMGLTALESQKLSIKLEVDANPPAGWKTDDTLVNKIYLMNIRHYAVPSLFATKLHACFFRKYVKGRDFYDLLWYLGRNAKPNYTLLNNAIRQTEGVDMDLSAGNIEKFLLDRLDGIDLAAAKGDVERFLEDKSELRLLERDVIANGIRKVFGEG